MINSKIQALSRVTHRSTSQTEFLLSLCANDFNKLLCLEQKMKENFLTNCPNNSEDVNKILNMPAMKYPWRDIIKDYIIVLLNINKSENKYGK